MSMPILPVDSMCEGLTDEEERLVRAAFVGKTGKLRAAKPFRKIDPNSDFAGRANYVWRMLCFDFVARTPYSCMPVMADDGICAYYYGHPDYADRDKRWAKVREVRESLDALVKLAERAVPVTAQAGVMRWGRALGMI